MVGRDNKSTERALCVLQQRYQIPNTAIALCIIKTRVLTSVVNSVNQYIGADNNGKPTKVCFPNITHSWHTENFICIFLHSYLVWSSDYIRIKELGIKPSTAPMNSPATLKYWGLINDDAASKRKIAR